MANCYNRQSWRFESSSSSKSRGQTAIGTYESSVCFRRVRGSDPVVCWLLVLRAETIVWSSHSSGRCVRGLL